MSNDVQPHSKQTEDDPLKGDVERLRLETEIHKLRTEKRTLEREANRWWVTRVGLSIIHSVNLHAALITALLAFTVSVVTAFLTWQGDLENRELEEFHRVVSDFSATGSALRAGSAVLLGGIARSGKESRRLQARSLLLAGLGTERDFAVRGAIGAALIPIGQTLVPDLREKRTNLVRELRIAFGRGAKPKCDSYSSQELERVRILQEGLLTLAKVLSAIEGRALDLTASAFRCALLLNLDAVGAQLQRATLWQADLSGAMLRGADFSDAQLDGVEFFDADIDGAKFCGPQLTGLTVEMVISARGWQKAYYQAEFLDTLKKQTGELARACL